MGHASTRTGIAVMISLGEAVLQILVADFPLDSFFVHVRFALMAFLICYCIAMQYFDAQPDPDQYRRMRMRHKRRDVIARLLQPMLIFSLFLVGVGFKLLLHVVLERAQNSSGEHHRRLVHALGAKNGLSPWWSSVSAACILLAVSMCLCQVLLLVFRLLRDGFRRSVKTWRGRAKLVFRLLFALAHGAVGISNTISVFFDHLDSGVGSLECHLFLILPEIVMHFAERSEAHDDEDDEDDEMPNRAWEKHTHGM